MASKNRIKFRVILYIIVAIAAFALESPLNVIQGIAAGFMLGHLVSQF